MEKAIRLSKWAELNGYTKRGAYNAFVNGHIPGAYQLPSGTIMVKSCEVTAKKPEKTVTYARVSTHKQKSDLISQSDRLLHFCEAKGWQVSHRYKEIASGLNDNRVYLNEILADDTITRIVVEHKDRLTRFGFNYMRLLLLQKGCDIYVVNEAAEADADLMQDFVSIITSMSARIYGLRRSRRKTELLIQQLSNNDTNK